MLVMAGLFADGQIQRHRAADVHVVLAPALRHMGQRVGVHGGLDLGIDYLCAADAGGIDRLIAQCLQYHGGIFQNFGFFIQIGEGVDAAVGENYHFAIGGDLVEHAMRGEMAGAQAVLLIKYSAHQVGGAQNALHQEIGLAISAQRHGLGGAVGIAVAGNDLILIGIFSQTGQHGADLIHMAHQNGSGDTLLAGFHHGLNDRLVVGSGDGDDTGFAALGSF